MRKCGDNRGNVRLLAEKKRFVYLYYARPKEKTQRDSQAHLPRMIIRDGRPLPLFTTG